MLADIATGNTGTADVLFLIAAIVFGMAALVTFVRPPGAELRAVLVAGGLCLVSVAWLVL